MNQNLVKMYQAQGEFEQSLNSIGQRQSELFKKKIKMQEWYLFDRIGDGSTPKPEHSIPEFTPSNASYKFEAMTSSPPNLSHIGKRDSSSYPSFILSLLFSNILFVL